MIDNDLPDFFYVGKIQSEWPLLTFVNDAQVIMWLMELVQGDPGTKRRRAWKLIDRGNGTFGAVEMVLEYQPPRLMEVEASGGGIKLHD